MNSLSHSRLLPLRLVATLSTLVMALFVAPVSGMLSQVLPMTLSSSVADVSVLFLGFLVFATLTLKGRITLPQAHLVDYFMLLWLGFGAVTFAKTLGLTGSFFATLIGLRYLFVIPVLYFLIRLSLRTAGEGEKVLTIYLFFLKAAILYTLLEFIAVNYFGLADTLSSILSKDGATRRFFDPFARLWLKPASPIAGSQNASFLALIAFFLFLARQRTNSKVDYRIWMILAGVVFCLSVTATALLALLVLLSTSRLRITVHVPKFIGRLTLVLACASLVKYREQLYSLRDKGSLDSLVYRRLEGIVVDAFRTAWNVARVHPFGRGWPGPQAISDVPYQHLLDEAPQEVYLLRILFYVGPFFVALLLALHGYLFIRTRKMSQDPNKEFVSKAVFVVTCALIVSTAHYETFTRFGFSYLYAFCLACVPLLDQNQSSVGREIEIPT